MQRGLKPIRFVVPAAAGVLAALGFLLQGTVSGSAAANEIELSLYRVESFAPHFAIKREMNRRFRPEVNELKKQMHKRMLDGENMACASHIYEETHWLINYTDRTKDIEHRIADLRKALDHNTIAPAQDPTDGSFGACFKSWLWRFFRSVDPLKELAKTGKKPEYPLKIWEPVDTPEEINALMRSLLVSDMDGGHNKRKELNLAITALGQLLWLDYTAAVFPEHLDRDVLAKALRKFVDEEWQDPKTGYWGAWYRDGDEVKHTNDLSITFHIVSYLDGKVNHRDKMAATTLAISRERYPYGWHSAGGQNNHHSYDIARMINITWDEMKPSERAASGSALFIMMARSLALSIDDKGDFDSAPYTTIGEAYYFGVSFFAELGLFGNPTRRGEMTGHLKNVEILYDQIRRNLDRLDPSDPWVPAAKRKLAEIDG